MSHHSRTFLFMSDITCMTVHPLMEFELCFACVLFITFFAIDEIADIFGFASHRLFDDVFIAIFADVFIAIFADVFIAIVADVYSHCC